MVRHCTAVIAVALAKSLPPTASTSPPPHFPTSPVLPPLCPPSPPISPSCCYLLPPYPHSSHLRSSTRLYHVAITSAASLRIARTGLSALSCLIWWTMKDSLQAMHVMPSHLVRLRAVGVREEAMGCRGQGAVRGARGAGAG